VNRLLVVLLLLFGCIEFANAEKLTSEEYKKKQYEDLKKGDWVKISLNFEWAKRQSRNWPLGATVEATKNLRPKAIDIMTVWGCVNNKTKDYLTVQTYYILRRKQEFGRFSNTPGPNGIEKQVLKNTQIKPVEIESISPWKESQDPELPSAGRK
jgi:hypothetical protein